MIEGSARARLGRAVNTRTTMAAQKLDLEIGEEVDFFRTATAKDACGWLGPAEVVDVAKGASGIVAVMRQNRIAEIQTQNLCRRFHHLVFLNTFRAKPTVSDNVWDWVRTSIGNVPSSALVQVGHVRRNGRRVVSSDNSKHIGLIRVVEFFAKNHLCLPHAVLARFEHGIWELLQVVGFSESVVMFWQPGHGYAQTHAQNRLIVSVYKMTIAHVGSI
jgi:hypothetical protein